MRHHHIRIDEPYFERVENGQKKFEIRKNDRDYQVGDTVTMTKNGEIPAMLMHVNQADTVDIVITYVTTYAQKPGYCVFAFEKVEQESEDFTG